MHLKVGSWAKQGADELVNADPTFPKDQYKPVLAKAQKVIDLLKQANPQPTGIQPRAHRGMSGNSYTPNGAIPFSVTAMYFKYLCLPEIAAYYEPGQPVVPRDPTSGTVVAGGETGTSIYVNFNSLAWLVKEDLNLGKNLTVDGKLIFFSPKQIGDLRGLPLVRSDPRAGFRGEAVILTAGGVSPFKPASREQFLAARVRFARKQIEERQLEIQRSGNEKLNVFIKELETQIASINAYKESLSPNERQVQAIIVDQGAGPEKLFVPASQDGAHRLVTIDRSLFDPALPRQSVQLIVVYWKWDEKDAVLSELIRQFKQNFDFETLKQMLGR